MGELFGITGDGWIAVSTFAGPAFGAAIAVWLGIRLGIKQYARQQEIASVRGWYVEGGVRKLRVALFGFLSVHLQNFQAASEMVTMLRDRRRGTPPEPRPEHIPSLFDLSASVMPIDAFAATQDLLGDHVVAKWATHALSDITLATLAYKRQIEQPLRAYYDPSRPPPAFREPSEVYTQLQELVDSWQGRVSRHFRFIDFLSRIEKVFLRAGPTSHHDAAALRDDAEMTKIRNEMRTEYAKHFSDL